MDGVRLYTSRQAINDVLSKPVTDHVLRCRASAVERLRNDIALLVRWPALQKSLTADVEALRAALARTEPKYSRLDRAIVASIKRDGTTNGAHGEAKKAAAGQSWRNVLDKHIRRLRLAGIIRFEAGAWILRDECKMND